MPKKTQQSKPRFEVLMVQGLVGERRKESDLIADFECIVETMRAYPTAEIAIAENVPLEFGKIDVWVLFVRYTKQRVGKKALEKAVIKLLTNARTPSTTSKGTP